jgi:signal peptidase
MKILKVIYSIFVAFIVVIALLLIVSVLPITENYKVLVVLSGSMEPAIKTGSLVIIKPVSDYKVGDIVTFGQFGETKSPITHRIIEVTTSENGTKLYTTKGDVNNGPDQNKISNKDIVGKALIDIPYLGYAVDFAKKPVGFALIILVPAAIIIIDEVKNIVKEIKKKNAKA